MPENEFALLRQFASNGDAEAFTEIVNQHAAMVYGVCLRILENKDQASDAVQDTFLQLVRKAESITESLPNWLHKVAVNRAKELIRIDSLRKQRELKYASGSKKIKSHDETASWQEISVCIDEELEILDDETRKVLILRFFEGLTIVNIAEKCGISQQTVSRRIESGIELLRLKLKSRGVIVPAALFMALLSENMVKAAPASIMKELGKIAIAGSKIAIGAEIAAGLAVKTKIMVGMLIVLLGVGLTVVFSFITNGQDKPASPYELISKSLQKESKSDPNTNITVSELLNKLNEKLDSFNSIIVKSEYSVVFDYNFSNNLNDSLFAGRSYKGTKYERAEYRRDSERVYCRTYEWGNVNQQAPDIPKEHPLYNLNNYAYGQLYQNGKNLISETGGLAVLTKLDSYNGQGHTSKCITGHILPSYDERHRIDLILKKAESLSLRARTENITGSECYVIDSETNFGRIALWIDPAHGYNIARAEYKSKPRSPLFNGTITNQSVTSCLENVHFKKIDGKWVPVEMDFSQNIQYDPDSHSNEKYHHKVTEIVLNPDHDALGSFDNPLENPKNDPELKNGTQVRISGVRTKFTWHDGKVVDSNGHEVELDNLGTISLAGKALPKLSEFNVRLEPNAIKDKMLLLCFWDMNQRPSHNAVLSLNKQANSLLEKGLYMVFIHAGAVEEKTFTSWLKTNEIKPPVVRKGSCWCALGGCRECRESFIKILFWNW